MNCCFKKISAAVLALTIVCAAAPSAGYAGILRPAVTAGAVGSGVSFDAESGVLTLSGAFAAADVRTILDNRNITVNKIIADETAVFPADCTRLFSGNAVIDMIDISKADTSGVTSMNLMFAGNTFNNIILDGIDTSNVTSMNGMFAVSKIGNLDLSCLDTSSVTDMGSMFASCTANDIILSGLDASAVSNADFMFVACSARIINMDGIDLSGLTRLDGLFASCIAEKIIFTGVDASKATSMVSMFGSCSVKAIDLSGIIIPNVTNMNGMFYSCRNTDYIDLNNINASAVVSMSGMFNECFKLKTVDLSSFTTASVETLDSMFGNCQSIESINFGNFDTSHATTMNAMFIGCKKLVSLDLSSFVPSAVENMSQMFEECRSLESVAFGNFDTSNVTTMYSMFGFCEKLGSLDLSSFRTAKVQNMRNMFSGCKSLESLDLSSFDTSGASNLSYMFTDCSALTDLNVSSFDTSNVESIEGMFGYCTSLSYVDVSSFNTNKISGVQKSFNGSTLLAPCINTVNGMSISLDGTIGVNYYASLGVNTAKAVLSGPNGDVTITDLEKYKQTDGTYKFTYNVNSVQMSDNVSLRFFDAQDRQLITLKYNGVLSNYSRADYSVRNYINDSSKFENNQKLAALANALNNYGYAAENYFLGKHNAVKGIDNIKKSDLDPFKPSFGNDVRFSLVLDSATAARIYTDSNDVLIDGVAVSPSTSKYGQFYELSDIPAHMLRAEHSVSIDGKSYSFNPMSYSYRALYNDNASKQLTDLAKALYVYSFTAIDYLY